MASDLLMLDPTKLEGPIDTQEISFTTGHGGVGFKVRTYPHARKGHRTVYVVRQGKREQEFTDLAAACSKFNVLANKL